MSITHHSGARPQDATTARMPRLRRSTVAIALSAALAGGTLVAGAGQASAAPAPSTAAATSTAGLSTAGHGLVTARTSKPVVKVSVSRKTAKQGKGSTRPRFTVQATKGGDAVKGRVRLFVDGKKVNVKKLNKNGIVRMKPLLKHYDVGKNRIRLTVVPAKSTGLAKVKKHRTIRVKAKQTSGAKVVQVANRYVGYRYSYGGTSPSSGFDCSGFTSYVYKKATGKSLPRTTSAQKRAGKAVSRSQARPGDIVYTPGHVSIYAGNGKIIESARPGVGVVKRKMWQDNPTFVRV
ncbi:cell wall-associated NlpC family hydrolase [Isoptericola sp. CG 20/1183]|uniref:Cell wall-associated NlpC family hydrolase n=1 Tax=Isoptericola halotolerans TaxID=300560 RepID=A0ABX5EKX7_9MICO|nr:MULTISPECIES: C40 family peptidase [Isoptericola]PRZ09368.1 cell wall-associated NlpC family hydrolase [Isoptericola sp. CG 20/1183]PRZ10169.1 cell wall-associated NlpC family hydrolase [Isoptericola halotolerans]